MKRKYFVPIIITIIVVLFITMFINITVDIDVATVVIFVILVTNSDDGKQSDYDTCADDVASNDDSVYIDTTIYKYYLFT